MPKWLDKTFIILQKKWPSTLWAIFVLLLSILPGNKFPQTFSIPHLDKIVHFVFYFVLYSLVYFGYNKFSKNIQYILLFLVFIYGIGIECIQHYFIVRRYFDFGDVIANFGGSIASLIVLKMFILKNYQLLKNYHPKNK